VYQVTGREDDVLRGAVVDERWYERNNWAQTSGIAKRCKSSQHFAQGPNEGSTVSATLNEKRLMKAESL
jgi:hypothetical protein